MGNRKGSDRFAHLLLILLSLLALNVSFDWLLPRGHSVDASRVPSLSAFRFNFDVSIGRRGKVQGSGWHDPERDLEGTRFCWTSDARAQIRLPRMETGRDYTLEIGVAEGITAAHVDSLRFSLDEDPLPVQRTQRGRLTLFSATLDGQAFRRTQGPVLTAATRQPLRPSAISPGSTDARELGVRFERIQILPVPPRSSMAELPVGTGWSEVMTDESGRVYRRLRDPNASLKVSFTPPVVLRFGVLTANQAFVPVYKPPELFPPCAPNVRLQVDGVPVALAARAGPFECVLQTVIPAGGPRGVHELSFARDMPRGSPPPAVSWIEVEGAGPVDTGHAR